MLRPAAGGVVGVSQVLEGSVVGWLGITSPIIPVLHLIERPEPLTYGKRRLGFAKIPDEDCFHIILALIAVGPLMVFGCLYGCIILPSA